MNTEAVEQPNDGRGALTKQEQHRTYQRVWRDKRRAAGCCVKCSGPRGEDGTETMCRVCTREQNEDILELRARRVEEGLCEKCAAPRGTDGTAYQCRACANKDNSVARTWRKRLFKEGLCPGHRVMRVLVRCPACLYEAGAPARNFSFVDLLPPPASGDRLEVCVGCESCDRVYHKGGHYYCPKFPENFKLRDEHVGEEGRGLWLRFTSEDEQGQILIEYEGCSAPEKKCIQRMSKKVAIVYLRDYRLGLHVPSMCKPHAHDRRHLEDVVTARILHSASGSGQLNGSSVKAGRPRKFTDQDAYNAIDTLGRRISVSSLARTLNCSRPTINDWSHDQGYLSLAELVLAHRSKGV